MIESKKEYYQKMLYFAVPITIQLLITSSLNMIDSIMVGRLGVDSIAAVGVANKFSQIPTVLFQGFASGATIFCAQYWGTQNKIGISRSIIFVSIMTAVFSFLFSLTTQFFSYPILGIFSSDLSVRQIGSSFLSIIGYSYIFTALSMIFVVALKTTGEVRRPTLISIFALLLNTALNYLLIYGNMGMPKMGVEGAAIGTLISRIVQTGLLFYLLVQKKFLSWKIFRENIDVFRSSFSRSYFKITLPSIINHATWTIGDTMYFWLYAKMGTAQTAAISLIDPIIFIFTCVFTGISDASAVMVGNEIGARRKEKAVQYAKDFIKITIVLSILIGVLILIALPSILSLYEVSKEVETLVHSLMIVYITISIAKNLNYINNVGILRAGGDTKYVMWLDTIAVWGWGLPLAALSVYFQYPLFIVYLLANSHEVIRAILGIKRTLTKKWMRVVVDT
ncbi:MATE family efflux transporter [Heyndrickxia oleronia]|uniref:MATE family efflux transporter n=1 Tax=Heyndrickxia oleronia TaxID=38875 RepID=UPI0015D15D9C|nr:MATE family efflux transporter [Heyndrickxia oleronia]MCM3452514.1 MATE family efflux transporter [Heyndrickxia oleronia]NYV65229.1 MATE family efflux transporter [Bacillus sp. Gen3]